MTKFVISILTPDNTLKGTAPGVTTLQNIIHRYVSFQDIVVLRPRSNLLVPEIGTIRIATGMRSPIGFRVQLIKSDSISEVKVLRAGVQLSRVQS